MKKNNLKSGRSEGMIASMLLLSLLVSIGLEAVTKPSIQEEVLTQGITSFLTGRRMFYNAEAMSAEANEELQVARGYFLRLSEGFEQYYWLAKVNFVVAELEEARGEKRAAARAFTESGQWAEKALKCNQGSSEAHRLLADSYMRLMNYNGTIYLMSKGPQAMKLLNKAISLDKKNYAAFNSLATYYLNAPAIGGGSVDKGIEALRKALESSDEFDNFLSYVWLGYAYRLAKKEDEARNYFLKALEIYPRSPWAMGWLNEIK